MDLKLTHSLLSDYLKTKATPEEIAKSISLCGPTVDRLHKLKDDYLYEIEIITNRIDAASAFGVAREAAAILPHFDLPATLTNSPYDLSLKDLGTLPKNSPIKVQILNHDLVKRFTCIALTNVTIKPSPKPVIDQLESLDIRPINNVVDITNELTARFGQPVHTFDLDKLKGSTLILRESKKGEKILTLDGKTHTLRGGDIVIEDGSGRLVDLCGIMGGGLSDIDENTKNVLLFVQTYEPKRIRKTSLYTQERTLASQIFEKSPDPELVLPTLIQGVKLLEERAGAKISSNVLDIYQNPYQPKTIDLNLHWLNSFIGIELQKSTVTSILSSLGFSTASKSTYTLTVSIPSYRANDIDIKEDLAEEISRVYGYFRLPSVLPPTSMVSSGIDPLLNHELAAKRILVGFGFTEIFNYSLVSSDLFNKAAMKLFALKLSNPLSQDYEYMRTSLVPSLLQNLQDNLGKTQTPLRIFELANTYAPTTVEKLPEEVSNLTFATYGLDFLTTKGYLEALFQTLKLSYSFKPITSDTTPFIATQSAVIYINDQVVGLIGSVLPKVLSNFNLKETTVIVDLNFQTISSNIDPIHHFKPISSFPPVIQDLTIQSVVPISELLTKIKSLDPLLTQVDYLNSYQDKHSFRLYFTSFDHNLTVEEVSKLKEKILKQLN